MHEARKGSTTGGKHTALTLLPFHRTATSRPFLAQGTSVCVDITQASYVLLPRSSTLFRKSKTYAHSCTGKAPVTPGRPRASSREGVVPTAKSDAARGLPSKELKQ